MFVLVGKQVVQLSIIQDTGMRGQYFNNYSNQNQQFNQQQYFQQPPTSLPNQLKVLTLNYCGIMNNPFEFYSQSLWSELSKISFIFDKLAHEYFKLSERAPVEWNMGKVEQKVRLGRFAPCFHAGVGIYQSGTRFLTPDQFKQRWYAAFNVLTKKNAQNYDQKQIHNTYIYDALYFHALLSYVYGKTDFNELLKEDPQIYKETMIKFYDQSFLDEKRKLAKVQATLFKLDFDVLLMQEYSPLFEKFIASQSLDFHYVADSSHDTIIVVKRASFTKISSADSVLSPQEKEAMNWQGKTSFLLVDDILLINAHLSSGKDKNGPQMASLKQNLCALRNSKPYLHVILGGDLNAYLKPDQQLDEKFHLFPREEKAITTVKMRTKAQGQYDKGDVPCVQSKDKIITDMTICADSAVTFIDGHTVPNSQSYVPTDEHPFDHFMVRAVILRQ